jgi:hypothetical protein
MANHLCRDLLAQSNASKASPYVLALFLRRVLKFTYVGNTAFGINAVGTLLIATGDSTPTVAPTFGAGTKAGINYGGGLEYYVGIPIASYTVVAGDVNRLLVLKSTANPKHNSGIFRVTGTDVVNNRLLIDYRSAEFPPAEADDSIEWYLYEGDNFASIPASGTTSGGTGYRGAGSSTNGRIILQSPHATAWQVRICNENSTDYSTNGTTPTSSVCPGFGGDSAGDFPVGGRHMHLARWLDTAVGATFGGSSPGFTNSSTTIYRWTMLGDDGGQSFVCMSRFVSGSGNSQMLLVGIPDNEPTPLPSDNIARVFVIGDGYSLNVGNYLNDISFHGGRYDVTARAEGMTFGEKNLRPVSATFGAWNYLSGATVAASVVTEATAADSVYSSSTDLLSVAIFAGMKLSHTATLAPPSMPFEPRFMGTAPWVREGRANFGNFTLTTDAGKAWQHFKNGVFMEWGGPAVVA